MQEDNDMDLKRITESETEVNEIDPLEDHGNEAVECLDGGGIGVAEGEYIRQISYNAFKKLYHSDLYPTPTNYGNSFYQEI